MKKLIIILFLIACGAGVWYGWEYKEKVVEAIPGLESQSPILTFETTTSAEELMQKHQNELLKDGNHSYGKVVVRYLPCLLFQVKYTKDDKKTEEGSLLFSYEDGEMILNTRTFEMTHGFEDCLAAHADAEDFKLLHVLHIKGGAVSK
ncbi:MAG TPA: hypothetical protein VN457_03525, partial [Chlamydiales bacterium]|nr:hypothetical protein [Chlamydiales bacterium]